MVDFITIYHKSFKKTRAYKPIHCFLPPEASRIYGYTNWSHGCGPTVTSAPSQKTQRPRWRSRVPLCVSYEVVFAQPADASHITQARERRGILPMRFPAPHASTRIWTILTRPE
jgi:hypothetical protein